MTFGQMCVEIKYKIIKYYNYTQLQIMCIKNHTLKLLKLKKCKKFTRSIDNI